MSEKDKENDVPRMFRKPVLQAEEHTAICMQYTVEPLIGLGQRDEKKNRNADYGREKSACF